MGEGDYGATGRGRQCCGGPNASDGDGAILSGWGSRERNSAKAEGPEGRASGRERVHLARILWHQLKHGVPYDPRVWAAAEEKPKNSNVCTKMPPPSATNSSPPQPLSRLVSNEASMSSSLNTLHLIRTSRDSSANPKITIPSKRPLETCAINCKQRKIDHTQCRLWQHIALPQPSARTNTQEIQRDNTRSNRESPQQSRACDLGLHEARNA